MPLQTGAGGLQYAAFERTYKGLEVRGGDFVTVTNKAGQILSTSVAQKSRIGNIATRPTLASPRARDIAGRQVTRLDRTAKPTLVVHALGTPRLAWKVPVAGVHRDGDRVALDVYVDARNGRVIESHERFHAVNGEGNGVYNGPTPLPIDVTLSGSTYSLKDPSITNFSCQNVTGFTTFSGPDNKFGNGVSTDRESGCADAYYAVQMQNDMLTDWLGRNSFDGNGGAWPVRVGLNDVNAFYCDGSFGCPSGGLQVQIGHNQAGNNWISSMDVVAHEMGHGIDDHTPGGISGAGTQEFVGDVFAALTEHYDNQSSSYDPPDYLVGEEVNLVGQGPIRNMYNPSAIGDPNCYSSSIPNTEVHAAAGPGNHWFYLLAEGTNPVGKPASTTCNGTSLTGIGIQKAGKIFYNAMLMKTSSSSYLKYRTWTLTAAKNLYPGSCAEFDAVKAAWNAVSVPAQTGDPTCSTSGNAVTVNNPGNRTGTVGTATSLQMTGSSSGAGQTLTWSATGLPAGLSINTTTGLISGTPTTAAAYNVTVTAKDTTNATGSTSFTWTISGGGGGGSQLLLNPGFESGRVNWAGNTGLITTSTSKPARTGSWKAWFGGYGYTATENLTQNVTIPAGAASASLSFWVRIDSAETTTSTAYDTFRVQVVSSGVTSTLATYSNLNKNSSYVQKSFDLSAYKGKTVTVKFLMNEDSSLQTSFVVDDTAVNVS